MTTIKSSTSIKTLKQVLADLFLFNHHVRHCHWNATGNDFLSFHTKLDDVYTIVGNAIDECAEHLRQLDTTVDMPYKEILSLSGLPEPLMVSHDTSKCIKHIVAIATTLIDTLRKHIETVEADKVRQDFLIQLCASVEKQRRLIKSFQ